MPGLFLIFWPTGTLYFCFINCLFTFCQLFLFTIFQETSLESFVTPLDDEDTAPDEYHIFRTVVQTLEQGNPGWYGQKIIFYVKSTVFVYQKKIFVYIL